VAADVRITAVVTFTLQLLAPAAGRRTETRNGSGIPRVGSGVTKRHQLLIMFASGACMLALGIWTLSARQPATWVEPPAYEYTVRFRCGMELPPGQYTLTVVDGKVSKVVADDAFSEEVLKVRKLEPKSFPTLGVLFKELQQAREEDADVAEVSFHPANGHPTRIRLDYDKKAVDDESCSDIVKFAAS
jgi:hypothetical protein